MSVSGLTLVLRLSVGLELGLRLMLWGWVRGLVLGLG